MARLGEHFDETAGPLLQGLGQKKVDPRTCTDFQVIAHGPLFPAIADAYARAQILNWQGNVTGALEKGLCDALKRGGYGVLNTVNDSNRLCWRDVHQAFKWYFPKIASYPTEREVRDYLCCQHQDAGGVLSSR